MHARGYDIKQSIRPPIRKRKASLCVIIPLEVSSNKIEFFKDLFNIVRAFKVIVNFFEIVEISWTCLKKVVCL